MQINRQDLFARVDSAATDNFLHARFLTQEQLREVVCQQQETVELAAEGVNMKVRGGLKIPVYI